MGQLTKDEVFALAVQRYSDTVFRAAMHNCSCTADAEDVVHPNEFKMTNYLIDDYDALQFPVFPLQRMPRLRLFFKTLTSSTYADEFAEHHFRTMVMRDELGFVPSAGTGFAIGRRVLDAFRDEDLLPRNSLTEDYKLSLTLRMRGFRVHYVLEKVPRVDARGRTVWDYIATRSLFPSTLKAAVRQKARWVYGITMQSASMADVFGKSELTFAERTFLYKDLKAKFANFVLLPGYTVLAYFLVQTFAPRLQLPVMYPLHSPSWWMCVFLLFMMVERQVLRGRALANVYGRRWRSPSCCRRCSRSGFYGATSSTCARRFAHGGRRSHTCCCADERPRRPPRRSSSIGATRQRRRAKESLQRTETTRKPRMRRLRRKVPHGTRPTTNFSLLRCSNAIGAFWATRCWRGVSWSQDIWKTPWDRRVRAACGWGRSC